MHNLDLLPDHDVAKQWKEAEQGGQRGLAADGQLRAIVDLMTTRGNDRDAK